MPPMLFHDHVICGSFGLGSDHEKSNTPFSLLAIPLTFDQTPSIFPDTLDLRFSKLVVAEDLRLSKLDETFDLI